MKAIFKSKVFETLPSDIDVPSPSKRAKNFVNNNKAEIKVISVTSAGYDNEVTLWYYEYVYKK